MLHFGSRNGRFTIVESSVLVKAFALVEALANAGGAGSLAELAAATGQAKPTAHRVVRSLVTLGYVEQLDSGSYRLTERLRQLTFGQDERELAAVAQPVLRQLQKRTGETVNLGVMRQNHIAYLTVIESNHPLRRVADAGIGDPLLTTALGRAIVSSLPDEAAERLLGSRVAIERRTPKTVTDPRELRKVVAQARRDGYAIERDQTDLGVTCFGAPVLRGGRVVGAISISAPSARAAGAEEAWIDVLLSATRALSRQLNRRRRAIA